MSCHRVVNTGPAVFDCAGKDESVLHFDPVDCGKFYECSNGQSTHFDCAPGTLFDPTLQPANCNHAHLVDCSHITSG